MSSRIIIFVYFLLLSSIVCLFVFLFLIFDSPKSWRHGRPDMIAGRRLDASAVLLEKFQWADPSQHVAIITRDRTVFALSLRNAHAV